MVGIGMAQKVGLDKDIVFPLVWLTYKARLRLDLDRSYSVDPDADYFTPEYADRLSVQVKQSEDWLLKLILFQIGLMAFQIVGLLNKDASMSLLGVTIQNVAGIKEVVLAIYATMALLTWFMLMSRDTGLAVLEHLVELSSDHKARELAKLARPAAFNLRFIFPRQYDDWIFATWPTKWLTLLFFICLALISFAAICASAVVNAALIVLVYRNPTLGDWSIYTIYYAIAVFGVGVLFLVLYYFPLPFRDHRVLIEINKLRDAGDPKYMDRLNEVYGPNSKYRRTPLGRRIRAWIKR